MYVLTCLAGLLAALAFRIWQALPTQVAKIRSPRQCCKLCVFLGPGGHTAEMLQLLKALDPSRYTPRVYLVTSDDHLCEYKAEWFEHDLPGEHRVYKIPRARKLGQSWPSVFATTIAGFIVATRYIFEIMPDLILLNGPGTCIPICMAAYIVRILGIKRTQIIYVESFARVETLSLTGKILYHFADKFLVQWPELAAKFPRADYKGILV
ncbi:hypothetical protein VTP01DRAFT_4656 [Rhizomucor pusillus]|uniref:uncharacterized protein n=1 Tax=Rhizomucor pusillus TaxID=4840 RepID=UPI0037443437